VTKRLKRPRDPAQLAKLVLDIATGQIEDKSNAKAPHKKPTKKIKKRAHQ
jgi:hypothetical protein